MRLLTLIFLAAMLAFTGYSYAGTNKDTGEVCQGSTCNGGGDVDAPKSAVPKNYSTSAAQAYSNAAASGGSVTGSVTGGEQSVTVNSGDSYRDYTPSAYAPSVQSTSPCYVGVNGGIGVPGFSGAFGTAIHDKECTMLETIRIGQGSQSARVRGLADQLLEKKLAGYLDGEDEEPTPRGERSAATDSVTGLPSY